MKERFIELYKQHIERSGAEKLLAWLEATDFFTAPASTKYHLSKPGGLVEHSVHVYERLNDLCGFERDRNSNLSAIDPDTIAICGLLHDICKVNFYKVEMRNRKNERGQWEQYPFYIVEDRLPYGHGEKSVFIISHFMKLGLEESMAIR